MDDSAVMRRSGRRKIRPLKFWEFELEEDVEPTDITYDITVLTTNTSLITAYSHNPTTISRTKITNNNNNKTNNNSNNNTQLSSKRRKKEENEDGKAENNNNKNNKTRLSGVRRKEVPSEKDKTGDGNKIQTGDDDDDARITKAGKKKTNAGEEKTGNSGKMIDSVNNTRRRSIEEKKKRKMENEREEKPPGKKIKIKECFVKLLVDGITMEQTTDEPCDTTMENVNNTNCAHQQTNTEGPKEGEGKVEVSVNGKATDDEEEKKEEGEVSVYSKSNTLKNNNNNNNNTLQSQTQLELPSFRNIVSSTMVSCHSLINLDTTTTSTGTTKMRTGDEVFRAGNRGVDDTGVFKVPLCPAPPLRRRPHHHHRKAASFIAEPTLDSIAEEENDDTTEDTWGENNNTTTIQVTETGVRGVSVIANNTNNNTTNNTTNTPTNTTTNTTNTTTNTTTNNTTIIKGNTTTYVKAKTTNTKANTTSTDCNKRPSNTHIPTQQQQQQQNNNNNIISSTSLFTSTLVTSTNETSLLRRSGRARIKPLEFWNFETAEVTKMETGESPRTQSKSPIIQTDDQDSTSTSTTSTPTLRSTLKRRRLCYPGLNILDTPSTSSHTPTTSSHTPTTSKQHITEKGMRQEMEGPSERDEMEGLSEREEMEGLSEREEMEGLSESEKGLVTPKAKEMKFENLSFTPFETKEYKCFLAVSYQDTKLDLYAGFIFIERGNLVWNTTRYTNFYVIEGVGKLQVADNNNKGNTYSLKTAANACIAKGKKVLLKKDGRCKTLKIFVVLTASEGELNITQE
ncbi:hypothetical protein Pcinc_025671 [Petrolisthes cinctipes]|uniref:Uncharacterized protein n=1 Tax=Petrolisthes cinctipes TaxID=88211 RepID=A0AAE1KCQ0_PETCI|nr:hypothetical protein Pcinc_025671 [Petrolisthes cinctipes]